jgi:hypothetical protein
MSLFRSAINQPAPISDEAIERYLAAIRAEIDPDPLFRRRLRGHVLNRYVAANEGLVRRRPATEMGRIGRAVLYASFAMCLSVTGAMAASQQAIPGDLFYPLKLEIEALRERVVPDRLRDELAAYTLGQRIAELDRLAADGNWTAVSVQAEAVHAAYADLVALSPDAASLDAHLALASSLLERLPDRALAAMERAIGQGLGAGNGTSGPPSTGARGGQGAGANGQVPASNGAGGGQPAGGSSTNPGSGQQPGSAAETDATLHPQPQPQQRPTQTPKPKPAQSPAPTPEPILEPTPEPTPTLDTDAEPGLTQSQPEG